jgi:tRNA 2-thiouridine synthesizing protein A
MNDEKIASSIDTSGTCCPMPMVNTNKAIKGVAPGELLELVATDPATRQDIPDWCNRTGHTLVGCEERDGTFRYLIRRAS